MEMQHLLRFLKINSQVLEVGFFYLNESKEMTAKKVILSSKPLVFVSSIDSSRLSDDNKKYSYCTSYECSHIS